MKSLSSFAVLAIFCFFCQCEGSEENSITENTDVIRVELEDFDFYSIKKRSVVDEEADNDESHHREKRGVSFKNYFIATCKQRFCTKSCGAIHHWNQSTKRKLLRLCHHCHTWVCQKMIKILG